MQLEWVSFLQVLFLKVFFLIFFEEFMYYVVHNGTCNKESFIYLRISFSKLFMGFFSIISFNIPNENLLIKDFFNTKKIMYALHRSIFTRICIKHKVLEKRGAKEYIPSVLL